MQAQQAAVQNGANGAVPKKKIASGRKCWTPERFEILVRAIAQSVRALGASFARPAHPEQLARDSCDANEYGCVANDLLALVPRYRDLLARRKTATTGGNKGHNGGLQQHIYLTKAMTDFLNASGVLGNNRLPVDVVSGGLGVCTRALFTSALVAYVESHGLKHPTEKKYIARDQYLQVLIGEVNFEYLKTAKPKNVKKPKEGAKPRKPSEKVRMLERDGQQVLHFSFDSIPTICGFFIVNLPPRAITPEQATQLEGVREHLKGLTVTRKANRTVEEKAARALKKQEKVQQTIVPTQMLTLNAGAPQLGGALPQLGFNPGQGPK